MEEQKGLTGYGVAKIVIGILLIFAVLFLDSIWDFLRTHGNFMLEDGGLATLTDKFLLLIFLGILFIFLEVHEIKRNCRR